MAYYSAFQSNAFQRVGFQIKKGGKKNTSGGVHNYDAYYRNKWRRHEAEAELAKNNRKLELQKAEVIRRQAKIEAQRKRDIHEAALAASIDDLNSQILLLQQQNILIQAMIDFYIQEEEEIYILLLASSYI